MWLVFCTLVHTVLAQDVVLPVIARQIPRRVGITNHASTPGAWVIYELKMYFADTCDETSLLEPQDVTDIYDTGTRLETALWTSGPYAMDNALWTNWTADCMVQLGGCLSNTVGLGIDISFTETYAEAMAERESPWSVIGPLLEAMTIKCIQIWQSDNIYEKADDISIVQGFLVPDSETEEYTYEVVQTFYAVSGGSWSRRPAGIDTLWRLQNVQVTLGPWSLNELEFYEDYLCTFKLRGATYSIGSDKTTGVSPGIYHESNAFDDNVSTFWISKCDPIPGSLAPSIWGDGLRFDGCEPEQGFIGMEFTVPTAVRCVRLFQNTPRDVFEREQRRSWSAGFALQKWTGLEWKTEETFWDSKVAYGAYIPTLTAPFIGNAPGVWEDLRPPNRSCWRLINDDYTSGQWKVLELEFYTSEFCVGVDPELVESKIYGLPLAMQGPQDLTIDYVFDREVRQDRTWQSTCTMGREGSGSCIPGEAWLGMYTRGLQPDVKCFKIYQSKYLDEQSSFVSLQVYLDGIWTPHSQHPEIGGGTWNRRPAPPWTLWRIRNNNEIRGQWTVHELRAYRDPLCLVQMTPGLAVASGNWGVDLPSNAYDADSVTAWVANCPESCNQTRRYWIGMELPADAEDAIGETMVRCFRVWQSEALHKQMVSVQVQVWNGELYAMSPVTDTGSLQELGGGVWSRPTASFMTKWRLIPNLEEDRLWRLLEVELFADSACKYRLPKSGNTGGGTSVLASGYLPFVPYFDRIEMGAMWSEAEHLQDEDLSTGLLLEHMPQLSRRAFVGVDFLSASTWVKCVKIMQGPMPQEYIQSARLEVWDGREWRSEDPELTTVEVQLDGLGGGGWQRRPAAPGSMWRVENAVEVPQGWAIYEVEFFTNSDCQTGRLEGEVIASGYAPPLADHGPINALDQNTSTIWLSQCCPVDMFARPVGFETFDFHVGCNISDAWVGVDLGADKVVEQVRCVRIFQVGFENMQSPSAWVSKWDGGNWSNEWRMDGLGGSEWNRRPAGGNSMWRLYYLSRKDNACPTQLTRITQRPWGVSDLKFFTDDDCFEPIDGGIPITSGSFDFFQPTVVDEPSYASARLVDDEGSALTTWAANCRTGFRSIQAENTDCTGAWVGMQWQTSHEVRCVKLVQSRLESGRCCDAADELELQRWNGSRWVEASWFREPPTPANPTANNVRAPVHLGAVFKNVGECPSRLSDKRIFEEKIVEKRSRRDSDKCIVKLTGAVPLLAEPNCIKHPRCIDVFGTAGTCCPIGNLVESANRCCCSFMSGEPIFVDEFDMADMRDKLSFEYATIWMSNVLPWIGLGVTIFLYLAVVFFPADVEARAKAWIRKDLYSVEPHRGKRLFLKRLVVIAAWPLLAWRTYLQISKSETSKMIRWFVLPHGRTPRPLELYRSLFFLVGGSVLSGMAPWLMLGAILGEMMIGLALQLCQVIRYFRSPFDPLDLRDMQLRQEVSRVKVKHDDGMASALDVASSVAATFVFGLAYFGKFVFDLLIVRAQMLSFEAIENIEADKVVELFPGLLETLREPAMLLYDMMYFTSQAISWSLGRLVGIPLCEGSCALAGSVALVMILYGASQWLNYDLFGLFVAARQVVRATRPECQRVLAQSLILFCLSASFAAVQMTMVLFTRALAFANPFQVSTWVCEYDDTLAIFVGRLLLTGSSLVGLVFVFLCVNGHFMGQDYITARVASFLGIDLTALDPDGIGEEGGMFRLNVFGAALPTLFGVWWDPWNIDAYLVHERAHVYSMELRDPQACKRCDKIHVQYELMMTATGRTVSAAVQIVPYGAVVAKACEYLNDPPLIYIGNKMSCLKMKKLERPERPRKKNLLLKLYYFIAEVLAYSVEYLVPFLRRLTSIGILFYLALGTFTLTEKNLAAQGSYVIIAGFTLSFVKASLERFVPTFLKYGLTGVYFAISSAQGKAGKVNSIARTITGQVLSGSTAAALTSGCILTANWASIVNAIIISSSVGYAFSVLTLVINACLESPPPEEGVRQRKKPLQLIGKIFAAVCTGGGMGVMVILAGETGLWLESQETDAFSFQNKAGSRWTARDSIGLTALMVILQFVVLRVILVETQQPLDEQSLDREPSWRKSPTMIVLRSIQFFPGFAAIPTCTLISTILAVALTNPLSLTPLYQQILLLVLCVILANISALTIHRLMDSFPQLMGFFSCVLSACMLMPWNFLFGAFTAVWIGVAVGSILEEVILRRTLQREIKRRAATGEDDMAFFDHKRAASMEEWQELEDDETEEEPPPEPDRQDKLQTYLELAAAGHSPIDYVRESSGLPLEDRFTIPESELSESQEEEGSVEVDALEDEMEEDEPRPAHRSRSLDLIKSHSYPSSSSLFDPPDLVDDGDDHEEGSEGHLEEQPPQLVDAPAEDSGLRAVADVDLGDLETDQPELPALEDRPDRGDHEDDPEDADADAEALVVAIPVDVPVAPDAAAHAGHDAPDAAETERDAEPDGELAIEPAQSSGSQSPTAESAATTREAHMRAAASKGAEANPILKSLQPKKQDLWSKIHGSRQPRAVPSLRPPGSQRGQASSSRSPAARDR